MHHKWTYSLFSRGLIEIQPRIPKVTVYLEATMPLLFSFAFIFSKKQPKGLCPKDSIRKGGSLRAVRFKQFNFWLPVRRGPLAGGFGA